MPYNRNLKGVFIMIIFIVLVVLNICFWSGYIIQHKKEKHLRNEFWELQMKKDKLYNDLKKKGLIKD